ncbi:PREDICTED: uncharacterized protein LOC105557475 [Vollenhovia emeryi]|uniref:uncharacterized protein LOC105557475 n=1 Tax=Vollenhovia emeryi TaxID=411798 RepID=UPI0005F3A789|nr:PREDICTED: uncharacterized protein LOC105557475 [Vollenhovia emeryi]XP_011860110.1 PREDICTED: uncharacterized protein LOC105557475 [Vollenhovia emeryi]
MRRHTNRIAVRIAWFVRELNALAHRAKQTLSAVVTMTSLTSNEMRSFWNANRCHICGEPFEPRDQRVRDHCHITGRYRGPAHARCNINNYNNSFVIPVFFHNLSGYDAHFIIEKIANGFEGRVELLPLTKETYRVFRQHTHQQVGLPICLRAYPVWTRNDWTPLDWTRTIGHTLSQIAQDVLWTSSLSPIYVRTSVDVKWTFNGHLTFNI